VTSTGTILARLVTEARQETERRRSHVSLQQLHRKAERYSPKDFAGALRRPGLAVIAEMKQRTPSMGVLVDDYRPAAIAAAYESGGAAALSVLTHETSFGGAVEHIEAVRGQTALPLLRKDFITEQYQVIEARAAGADAVLLIVAALDRAQLAELLRLARAQSVAALVEVHDEDETDAAVDLGADLIGVNHRDLRTFAIDLGLTARLRPRIPPSCVLVAESGIHGVADARRMRDAGADAILVGELLMRAADPAACVRDLGSI
jgi:indole-3-glycerol phosphate synthase